MITATGFSASGSPWMIEEPASASNVSSVTLLETTEMTAGSLITLLTVEVKRSVLRTVRVAQTAVDASGTRIAVSTTSTMETMRRARWGFFVDPLVGVVVAGALGASLKSRTVIGADG